MNIHKLKDDIFNPDQPKKQIKAAYEMRYIQNNPQVVNILFRACYEAKNPKLQQEAVRSLGILKKDLAMETFTKSTYNLNTEKRRRAYYHLGTLGNPKGIKAVLKGLSDHDKTVRRAAVISAGRLGKDYSVINALKKLNNDFEPEAVRREVQRSINFIKQRINGGRSFNVKRTFNKPKFQKTSTPRAYTPKAF